MPEVTSHAPGTPSWAELDTTDETGALSFYSALFGWEDDPQEITPDWYYHMQRLNGLEAASMYRQSDEEREQNVPSHWNLYFTVTNVDETAEIVKQNGGTVVFGPMDVFEAGRMAFCQDPQGAYFAIWQANQHIGCRIKGETGAMCWNELVTTDRNAAIDFYMTVLGMERGEVMQPHEYAMLKAGGIEVAGVMQITPEMGEFPPHWSIYFGVDNADATVEQAQSLGATVYVPSTDIIPAEGQPAIGRFAAMADPQGAVFSVFQAMCETPQG
jgi:predicted enzyme related to lactoylglutathione lyase